MRMIDCKDNTLGGFSLDLMQNHDCGCVEKAEAHTRRERCSSVYCAGH